MNGALFPVLVDDREQYPSPETRVNELRELGVPAKVDRLAAGDYQWAVQFDSTLGLFFVVVERKSVADFLSSVRDGRINHFLDLSGGGAPHTGTMRFLLLEGNQFQFADFGSNPMSAESLDNALVSLQRLGVVVVRSAGAHATAERIRALRDYTSRADHTTFLRVVRPEPEGIYFNPVEKEKVRALMALPGWGEARARAALAHFPTVGAVLDAVRARDHKAFADVKGIGKGLVLNAADFLYGPPSS